jgi:hypothetical protein
MQINLNQPFTSDDVRAPLTSKDDSQSRQLRVTTDGIAYLSDGIENNNTDGRAFRVESWIAGNSYTGDAAAKNPKLVARVERLLRDNWPNPSSSFIDIF